ncbi:MAG: CHAT domain-containing protein [Bacteroidales bacterium]
MAKRITAKKSNGIISILSLFIFFLSSNLVISSPQSQKITQAKFSEELGKAYVQNNDQLADSLIKDHRLFVKPFVNDLIKESISNELKEKAAESKQATKIAEKAATGFEKIFGEKSLTIGVSYLTSWTKEQKEKKLVADSLFALGTSIRGNSVDRERAIGCYQQALDLYKEIGDERGEGEILGGMGLIYSNNKDYNTALAYYREALKVREKVDDKFLMGNSLNSIGTIYYNMQNNPQAIHFFDKAEALRKEIGDFTGLRRTQTLKAGAYLSSGEELNNSGKYPEALENIEKALEINRSINARSGIGDALNQMGFVYSNIGEYYTAVEKINEAASIMKEENDTTGLAGVYNHLGIVLQMSGKVEKALECFNKSLKIYEESKDQVNIEALLSNLGTLFFDTKDYVKAKDYLLKALQISREIKDQEREINCLLNLGNAYTLLEKRDDAMLNYKAGLDIASSMDSPDLLWKLIAGMAENYERGKEYDKAIALNDSALKILEDMRSTLQSEDQKASFMARERFAFEYVINMLSDFYEKDKTKGYDLKAFQYAERSKSRAFLDLLAESLANVKEGVNSDLLKKQDELLVSLTNAKQSLELELKTEQLDQQKISELKEKIKVTEEDLSKINQEIRKTNPRYADLHYPEPVTLKEAQAICPDKNTVLLEYSVGDSSSCLWVISRSAHQLFKLPGRKTLQEQIESFRFALLNPDQTNNDFFTRGGYSLYQTLLRPAESFFTKKSKLVIIPDGILNYLPFEVLLTNNKGIGSGNLYSGLPFLIKKYPVSYGQSASVLKSLFSEQKRLTKSGSDNKKLIAFGDPVYENVNDTSRSIAGNYKRLEYSGNEIENIASYFKKGNAEVFLRNDATEENVKKEGELKKFNYIHFATHGFIDEAKPDFSSLVLTKTNNSEEDGFLQATEIFNLNLNADLVVLSACQTGLGKLIRGEGMVGLTRAFMYAGTPTVMVSLWSVSDASTATLMGEFYKNLVKEKLYKTDALRKAQLTMLGNEKFAHPFYWAPFVLVGDWR